MSEKKGGGHGFLTLGILIAIVLAIALALLFPHAAESLEIGGEIFLRLLKMIVVPLVVTSVLSGILGLGDVRKLGKPGAAAIGYYLMTTVIAVTVGLCVVNVINPGAAVARNVAKEVALEAGGNIGLVAAPLGQGPLLWTASQYPGRSVKEKYLRRQMKSPKEKMADTLARATGMTREEVADVFKDLPSGEAEKPSLVTIFKKMLLMLVTDNLVQSALETNLLPLIVFSIIFGAMLTTLGSRVQTLTELIEQANTALMNFVLLLMKVAPLGIFCLVTARFGKAVAEGNFVQELTQIGWYFLTVLIGLGIHALIILPIIFFIFRRQNPFRFMYQMSQAVLTAFSTASSSATLPVTMECAETKAGISKRATEFVIPLGATINMDGTALYEAAAAIFIAQVVGYDLSFADQIVVAVTATLAAIGAAGIPEAGLITMLIVLNAVGLPVEYVGLILSVDWLLDRFRTAVNAFGDSVGAAVVEKTMPVDVPSAETTGAT